MTVAQERKRVAVGLSGGVDSSVAIVLLKEAGYDVIGITMEIYNGALAVQEGAKHACYGPGEQEDVELCRELCGRLKVPYHAFDLKEQYRIHVLDYFKCEYQAGRTPNPCVVCNYTMKFGFLLDAARKNGVSFDYFATGHYARIEQQGDRFFLKKAKDQSKDQTYFLYRLSSDRLASILFPLGDMTKQEVRDVARSFGLPSAERTESQDFVAGGDYAPLFQDIPILPGNIVDEDGRILGRHRGIVYYTVGQRRGLGISSEKPLYVLRVDAQRNEVVVTANERLFATGLYATDVVLNGLPLVQLPLCKREGQGIPVTAKIRQNQKEFAALLFPGNSDTAKIVFEKPERSVTPGQSVVLYLGEYVLGGGIIDTAIRD